MFETQQDDQEVFAPRAIPYGGGLASYLVLLTQQKAGTLSFRTGAGSILRDLLVHWPVLEDWEDRALELCERITDAVYPLAAALYAQAVEISATISSTPIEAPTQVEDMSSYIVFDTDKQIERQCLLSARQPRVQPDMLSTPKGVAIVCRPLNYQYHTLKDDRKRIERPRVGMYEPVERLVNALYDLPGCTPPEIVMLDRVKAKITELPSVMESYETSRAVNLAMQGRRMVATAPTINSVSSLSALPPPVRALARNLMSDAQNYEVSPHLRLALREIAQTLVGLYPQATIEEAARLETSPPLLRNIPPVTYAASPSALPAAGVVNYEAGRAENFAARGRLLMNTAPTIEEIENRSTPPPIESLARQLTSYLTNNSFSPALSAEIYAVSQGLMGLYPAGALEHALQHEAASSGLLTPAVEAQASAAPLPVYVAPVTESVAPSSAVAETPMQTMLQPVTPLTETNSIPAQIIAVETTVPEQTLLLPQTQPVVQPTAPAEATDSPVPQNMSTQGSLSQQSSALQSPQLVAQSPATETVTSQPAALPQTQSVAQPTTVTQAAVQPAPQNMSTQGSWPQQSSALQSPRPVTQPPITGTITSQPAAHNISVQGSTFRQMPTLSQTQPVVQPTVASQTPRRPVAQNISMQKPALQHSSSLPQTQSVSDSAATGPATKRPAEQNTTVQSYVPQQTAPLPRTQSKAQPRADTQNVSTQDSLPKQSPVLQRLQPVAQPPVTGLVTSQPTTQNTLMRSSASRQASPMVHTQPEVRPTAPGPLYNSPPAQKIPDQNPASQQMSALPQTHTVALTATASPQAPNQAAEKNIPVHSTVTTQPNLRAQPRSVSQASAPDETSKQPAQLHVSERSQTPPHTATLPSTAHETTPKAAVDSNSRATPNVTRMRNVRQKQTFSDGGNVSTRKPLTTPPPVNRSEPITVPQRRFPAQPVQAQERTNRAAMPEEPSRPDTQRVTAQQLRDNRPSLSGKNARSPTSYLQPGRDQFFTAPHHLLVDPENRRHGYYDKLDRNEQHSEKMSVAPVKLNKKALLEKTVYPPSGFPHPLLWALSSLSAPTASDSKPKITVSSTFDKRVKKQTAFSRLHRWVFPTPSPFPVPSTNSLRTKI